MSLTPDPRPLLDAVAALHECVDLIEAEGPKGGMWGQTYGYALRNAQARCEAVFGSSCRTCGGRGAVPGFWYGTMKRCPACR